MKGTIRTVLVDPREETRHELRGLLGGVGNLRLVEACASYESAAGPLAEHRPTLVVIALDADPARALALIESTLRAEPSTAILPASTSRDPDLILKAMRAGAREFLTLPAGSDELSVRSGGSCPPAARAAVRTCGAGG